ncbi:unnamed protein product [Rotaria magnacalcarata]|uniref:Uncharacterized protein n=1 Tax=Rotaria magnacalcarata TaxID=392030 RepID=A0A819II10_9BILA|nr:unnamed protein product [Rotaria magnacalcarata]CAF3914189.1 unnamed protein product [Rotaria magnacalcarata]CAF4016330.1 unnamed protein product [Rotaria magnacalcarata]CAF4558893.1 unnamed protein product [Rotaria magnacalcarata]
MQRISSSSSLVISSMAAPSMNDRQEIYLDTCQISCGSVSSNDEAEACREKFCPNYVTYLMTGLVDEHMKPVLASNDPKEVGEFCASWILHLIHQFGWQNRINLDLNDCICAAGKDCFIN